MMPTPTHQSSDPVPCDRVVVVPGQLALPFQDISDGMMTDLVTLLLNAVVTAFTNVPWDEDCPFD